MLACVTSNKYLLTEGGYEMIHTGLIFSNKDGLYEKVSQLFTG